MDTAEVAVIGAGVTGLATALELARRGCKKVTVLDKGKVAGGNTRLSGGILRFHDNTPEDVKLSLESLSFFQEHREACAYRPIGFLVMEGSDGVPSLRRDYQTFADLGVKNRWLSSDELASEYPELNLVAVEGGVFEPDGGFADPVSTCACLRGLAEDLGVEVCEGRALLSFKTLGPTSVRLETSSGPLEAGAVVMAAGPWSNELLPDFALPMKPLRGQIAFFDGPGQQYPAMIDQTTGLFLRPHEGGRVLAGLGTWPFEEVESPERFKRSSDRDYVSRLTDTLLFRVADCGSFKRGHAGIYDVTPDWKCILDKVPDHPVYLALGLSGTGFRKAPAIGRILAEMVLDGKRCPDFSLARFEQPPLSYCPKPEELPPLPIEPSWVKVGQPEAHGEILNEVPGDMSAGVWTCEPGEFEWHFDYDEFVYLLEGEMSITELGGQERTFHLKAGDMIAFPSGAVTYWKVTKKVRKYFVIRSSENPFVNA